MTLSFSWADLLMVSVILIYTIKLFYSQIKNYNFNNSFYNNIKTILSSVIQRITNVSRETFLLFLFLLWTGLSILWSSYQPIAIYRFATLIELVLFALVAIKSLKSPRWLEIGIFTLIANGLFQSILGIVQFVFNKSIGLRILGESILSPNLPGVAKIIITGGKHIRAYGTFPHPNILAGFLIIPIFLIIAELLKRSTCAEKINEPRSATSQHYQQNCTFAKTLEHIFHRPSNQPVEVRDKKVPRGTIVDAIPTWLVIIFFLLLLTGLLLTFSRSAFLGMAVGSLVLLFYCREIIPKQPRRFFFPSIILIVLIFSSLLFFNRNLISLLSTQSLAERNLYQNISRETISAYPATGIGIGQFVLNEYQRHLKLAGWQYQPVHNIYLLAFSELGIVGLALFLLLVLTILTNYCIKCNQADRNKSVLRSDLLTYLTFCCIIISFLFVSLFDHYFWDIKLGLIIFTLPIIFLKTVSNEKI
ncbi:MAG: O-antigen ligase family protein [Patescibacteria group bacterium]|nr:O-antigen ligase family protein [Patescibacteria group bacterium]